MKDDTVAVTIKFSKDAIALVDEYVSLMNEGLAACGKKPWYDRSKVIRSCLIPGIKENESFIRAYANGYVVNEKHEPIVVPQELQKKLIAFADKLSLEPPYSL